ncbi:uncharacterized protein LOC111885304 [Lactuca sativa]|uniref:uncharacterized protein LOC111885304 n=1 Tax=Lactuca sativa TaxID=4236 RepID=UPI000CBD564F|nr:uncharacterized protein LOC111885304 [Lactuca sativa]
MDSVLEFLYPKLILFVLGFWSSVATYLLHLIRCLTRITSGSSKGVSNDLRIVSTEAIEASLKVTESNMEFEEKQELLQFLSIENDDVDEKVDEEEAPEFSFTFKFPTFEEFNKNQKDFSDLLNLIEPLPEFIDPIEVSMEASKTDTNSDDGSYHVSDKEDQTKDDFEDQGVNDETMVESPNEQKIEEEKEQEEIDTSMEEKLHDESSISSRNLDSPTNDLQFDDGFLSDLDFELQFDEKEQKNWSKPEFLSENDFSTKSRNLKGNENEKSASNDTTNKLESLWEHQELIEQLKMEIKKVKAIGLPTIFEESESPPKIMEELKPWKIEEVYQNGGKMSEVHKFYKSYRERMRKFDIFNYQKMYAIGFLHLKDPLESSSSSKSLVPEITTLLNQSFTTTKGKKHENDPTIKFIKELQSDLEVVYVGQMCLSWEILHWQYEKALEIWESDPHGIRRFNDIADEFQQFQVLIQRFVEDESFQGPRIQNYVKNRCVFRNLLQVPVIREDHSKNKKAKSEVFYDITSDTLVEILEESIRIFWRFVRADKYKRQTPIEFQKPEDSQLFTDLQKDLHKKERKLKEQLRSGNCILKKLRRCKEEEEIEDQVLYFFCQVDMKLVSRVLQMSRLTSDQLIWCHNKLSKVSFVNRKIHVEPSFLLFPC